jgi:hypothetical protein
MMKTMIKTAGAASLLAMAVAGTSAVAAPLAQLGFSQHAGFSTPTFFGGSLQFKAGSTVANPDAGGLAPAGTSLGFAWEGGNAPAQSSIGIQSFDNDSAPTVDVDGATPLRYTAGFAGTDVDGQWNEGDWWVIDTITQTNEALDSLGGAINDPLWTVDTLADLRIFADAGRTTLAYQDPTTTNQISFNETLNQTTCAGLNPLGTNCDDVFTASTGAFAPVSFNYMGYKYDLSFQLLPGISTNDGTPVGPSVVVDNGTTISVFTPENDPGTSSIHIAMSYTATLIPEPSVLGLFGAGVLALGFAGRRRKNVSA